MKVRACDFGAQGPMGSSWSQAPVQVEVGVSIIRAGESGTIDRRPAPLQWRSRFCVPVTRVETKKAAHRFSAIKMRSLNDARQSSFPTVLLHLDQVPTDASVPIRLLISTPAQQVSRICAETDVLQR